MSRRTQKPKQPESFLNWPFAFRKPTESREARKEEKGDFRQLPTKTSTKLPACNRIVIFFSSHVFNPNALFSASATAQSPLSSDGCTTGLAALASGNNEAPTPLLFEG
jgi:hypothetical protein